MKYLATLNAAFWKYRTRFFMGMVFVVASNYLAVLAPQITGYVIYLVQEKLPGASGQAFKGQSSLLNGFISVLGKGAYSFGWLVAICSLTILALAILRGVFMFFMRQTIIVMSRHIEYDQKNQIYQHYQKLDASFYKIHPTGDLMNRISEDVSRVRMYTGPAIMYLINLVTLIAFCLYNMLQRDVELTLLVLSPLPVLALTIYWVNSIINHKSEKIQENLSALTSNAQETYAGIRVIKSFAQEKDMLGFFRDNSAAYKKEAIGLAKVEALYFPSMTLMIGLSTLATVLLGGWRALQNPAEVSTIVEFVMYINMLTFPVSAIGWTASMIQRAAASQKRILAFLSLEPNIKGPSSPQAQTPTGEIVFDRVSFTYAHTGVKAIEDLQLRIAAGQKVLVLGKTGSGKTTLAQLLLRQYDPTAGQISIGGIPLTHFDLKALREGISYVPQDVFLFSETISQNIQFGLAQKAGESQVRAAADKAGIGTEIERFEKGFETLVGERGVTLSGGQKQRVSIARALIKADAPLVIFDDCLSAVDAKTEAKIMSAFSDVLQNKTAFFITHRIFAGFAFDQIIVLEEGRLVEQGTHEELMALNGYYAERFEWQMQEQRKAVEEA